MNIEETSILGDPVSGVPFPVTGQDSLPGSDLDYDLHPDVDYDTGVDLDLGIGYDLDLCNPPVPTCYRTPPHPIPYHKT